MKPARTRPLADQDLVDRTRYYAAAEGADLAERFFTAAIDAVRSVEDMLGIGSPLVGQRIGIDGLRRIGIAGSPCAWYYIERTDHLDVARLLADKQDLDDLLGGDG